MRFKAALNATKMKSNLLVTRKNLPPHKKIIGVVVRVLKRSVEVDWGIKEFEKIKREDLEVVDGQFKNTISFTQWKKEALSKSPSTQHVIIGNHLASYRDSMWVLTKRITLEDLPRWPRVVEDHIHLSNQLNII